MMRVTTPCVVHPDCVLRITTDDDGLDTLEHSSIVEGYELLAQQLAQARDAEKARGILVHLESEQDKARAIMSSLERHDDDLIQRVTKLEQALSGGIGHELQSAKEAQLEFGRITRGLEQRFDDLRDSTETKLSSIASEMEELRALVKDIAALTTKSNTNVSQLSVQFEDAVAKTSSEVAQLKAELAKVAGPVDVDELRQRVFDQILQRIGG